MKFFKRGNSKFDTIFFSYYVFFPYFLIVNQSSNQKKYLWIQTFSRDKCMFFEDQNECAKWDQIDM